MIPLPVAEVPLKCKPETAANVPNNPCDPAGSKPRCLLCPVSPTYWRKAETTSLHPTTDL